MSVQTAGAAAPGTIEHYRMPDAGEGLTEAEVVTWRVAVGDVVEVNDVVVEVETAKSLVELPCPFAGTVVELLAAEGETVAVGTPILAVRTGDAPAAPGTPAPAGDAPVAPAAPVADGPPRDAAADDDVRGAAGQPDDPRAEDAHRDAAHAAPVVGDAAPSDDDGAPVGPSAVTGAHPSTQAAAGAGRTAVLVGYGPAAGATRRRARRGVPAQPSAPVATAASAAPASEGSVEVPPADGTTDDATDGGPGFLRTEVRGEGGAKVLAKPPVRKLARDLGVDLAQVPAGDDGIVTREAVMAASEQQRAAQLAPDRTLEDGTATGSAAAGRAPADETGDVRVPVKGVRKATADAMVASAFTAPHVTEWVQVDVTESVRLLERLKAERFLRDVRLSPFTLVARAMCLAVRRHPTVNVSWDEAAREIVVHGRVGLGFAAATDRGLVVPVVPDAGSLDLPGLARQVAELVDTARAGRLQPAQQAGVTLTVTNVGVFGVDGGTPILPPGTGLILACGQVRRMPWVVGTGEDERVVPRDVMTLAVSFDHRMIDGELGSRYLADVARVLTDPGYALAWS